MQVQTHPFSGKVVAMQGKAVARGADGRLRLLAVGDWVADDEVIVTAQNGFVQLATGDAPRLLADAGGQANLASPELYARSDTAAMTGQRGPDAVLADGAASLVSALRVDALGSSDATTASLSAAVASLATAHALAARAPAADREAPIADANSLSVSEDTPLPISLSGHDFAGVLDKVVVVKVPTGGLLYKADGVPISDRTELTPAEAHGLVFVPAPDFHGNPGSLQFVVVDATGKVSAVSTVAIDVLSVNDAPIPGTVPFGPDGVAIPDADVHHLQGTHDYRYSTVEGSTLTGQVNATDVDRDPMLFSAAVDPLHGSVSVASDGRFVYTPSPVYVGADRFVVAVDDGHGGVATSTVFIDVLAPGTAAPGSADSHQATALGVAAVIDALGTGAVGHEVFSWALAEPAAVPAGLPAASHVSGVEADVLELSSLFQGHGVAGAAQGAAAGWAQAGLHLPELRLDLGLDWGLRTSGLELFRNQTHV